MKDIAVIVPVYNVYPFLNKCLDSLVNQKTTCSYEVICINDGSTDNSEELLTRYSEKYPNIIKVINQENKGVSTARNVGIAAADSKFVAFVDADDWVDQKFIQIFYDTVIINNSDLVIQDVIYVNAGQTNYEKEEIRNNLFNAENHIFNKLFSLKVIKENNISFPTDISIGEDMYFTFMMLIHSKKVTKVDEAHYFYRTDRENSAMNNSHLKKYLEINEVCGHIYQKAKELNLDTEIQEGLEYLFLKNMVVRMIPKILKAKKFQYFSMKKMIKEQFNSFEKLHNSWEFNRVIIKDEEKYFERKIGKKRKKQLESLKNGKLLLFAYRICMHKITS